MSNEKLRVSVGTIIEDLYTIRRENFEHCVVEQNGELLNKIDKIGEKLEKFISDNTKNKEIVEILDDLRSEINLEQNFWNETYYCKGVVDIVCYQQYMFEELCIERFEYNILKNKNQQLNVNKIKEELINTLYKEIQDIEIRNKIILEIDKIIKQANEDKAFWIKECYKNGYYDILQLKTECKKYIQVGEIK